MFRVLILHLTVQVKVLHDNSDILRTSSSVALASNPHDLAIKGDNVWVTDATFNTMSKVKVSNGVATRVAEFPQANGVDSVPTGITIFEDDLLITFNRGFAAGLSEIIRYDPITDTYTNFINGLNSALDIQFFKKNNIMQFLVVELTEDATAGTQGNGRLLQFNGANDANPTILSNTLFWPTAVVRDDVTGKMYVTENVSGNLIEIVP